MKFRCERDVLVEAVTTASRATSSRGGSLPVLAGLKLSLSGDNLEITGTDLDLTMTIQTLVAGEDDGEVVVPAKILAEIVRSLSSGAVHVETTESAALISGGRSQFSVHVVPSAEFPRIATPSGDGVTIAADAFAEGLRQVVPAASSDEGRLVLTGVLLATEGDGLRLVATDSYRLAVRDLPGQSILATDQKVLVPSRALAELLRLLHGAESVTLTLGEQDALFQIGSTNLITRLIHGEFPKYQGLIPSSQPNRLVVDRAELMEAAKRVKLMAREATPVRLSMRHNALELVAITQDVGQASEVLDADYEGDELTVAFNPDYLLGGLEATPGESVAIETVDALKPALLRATDTEEFLYLLMPVRVT